MTEWTNIFDLGECTVSVLVSGDPIFSQVMAKGDSQPLNNGAGENYTIAVSADGVVSFSNDDGSSYNNHAFDVRVVPSYAHDFPARVRGATFVEGTSAFPTQGEISEGIEAGVNVLPYDSVSPASPEPLDMSALTGPRDFVGVTAGPSF